MKKELLNFRVDSQTLELLAKVVELYDKSQSAICRDAISLGLQTLMEVKTPHLDLVKQRFIEIENEKKLRTKKQIKTKTDNGNK